MSDTEDARFTIARQAAELAKLLEDKLNRLRRDLEQGSVHSRHYLNTGKEPPPAERKRGSATFLYESLSNYDDADLQFNNDIHRLKSLITAVVALEELEEKE